MKKIVIGMTGPTGSGKSTVGKLLCEKGFKIVDADKTARRVTEKGSPTLGELCSEFGDDILLGNGELDRAELAKRAFADKESLEKLNSITHPAIINLIKEEISALQDSGETRIVLDAPQLFEASAQNLCDCVISVLADKETRLERIMARDNISQEQALSRINAQKSDEFFTENSDFVIYNNSDTEALTPQIDLMLEKTLEELKMDTASATDCRPISENPETQAKISRSDEKTSKRKLAVFGLLAVFVVGFIVGAIVFLTSSKYTDVIDRSIELCQNPTTQTIEEVYPEQMWDYLIKDRYSKLDPTITSAEDIIEKHLFEQTKEIGTRMTADFGRDWNISYEIISKEQLGKDERNEIVTDLENTLSRQVKIKKAYHINLSYSISGTKTSDGFMSFTAVKISGEWYAVEKIPNSGWRLTVLEF